MSDTRIPILRSVTRMQTVSERIDELAQMAAGALHNEKLTRKRLEELEQRVAALEPPVVTSTEGV